MYDSRGIRPVLIIGGFDEDTLKSNMVTIWRAKLDQIIEINCTSTGLRNKEPRSKGQRFHLLFLQLNSVADGLTVLKAWTRVVDKSIPSTLGTLWIGIDTANEVKAKKNMLIIAAKTIKQLIDNNKPQTGSAAASIDWDIFKVFVGESKHAKMHDQGPVGQSQFKELNHVKCFVKQINY